ncbi:hypothetical protein WMY93_014919 [Mugilogobius chulae]|uniref:Uncharacterized protein n=1 Tax=Mugilogobius chulae TaxID=88201 RepID=A0AAW0P7Y6_9GOBI
MGTREERTKAVSGNFDPLEFANFMHQWCMSVKGAQSTQEGTGAERTTEEQTRAEKTKEERSREERTTEERSRAERTTEERTRAERTKEERTTEERTRAERTTEERTREERTTEERNRAERTTENKPEQRELKKREHRREPGQREPQKNKPEQRKLKREIQRRENQSRENHRRKIQSRENTEEKLQKRKLQKRKPQKRKLQKREPQKREPQKGEPGQRTHVQRARPGGQRPLWIIHVLDCTELLPGAARLHRANIPALKTDDYIGKSIILVTDASGLPLGFDVLPQDWYLHLAGGGFRTSPKIIDTIVTLLHRCTEAPMSGGPPRRPDTIHTTDRFLHRLMDTALKARHSEDSRWSLPASHWAPFDPNLNQKWARGLSLRWPPVYYCNTCKTKSFPDS